MAQELHLLVRLQRRDHFATRNLRNLENVEAKARWLGSQLSAYHWQSHSDIPDGALFRQSAGVDFQASGKLDR